MTRQYDFHGVRIAIEGESRAVTDAIHDRLRHFAATPTDGADVTFTYRDGPQVEPPHSAGRAVYDPPSGTVEYHESDDVFFIDHGVVRVRCDVGEGRVVVSGPPTDVWLLSRPFLTLPLVEILKRRARFSLHAAGAAIGDRAVLVPGSSGSGKSTLAVALMRAGFDFLADDMVFLSRDAGLRVHPFPDETDISDDSAAFFPELAHLVGHVPSGWPKHHLRAETLFGTAVAGPCVPSALVFPRPSGRRDSTLEPLEPAHALRELAPNVLLTDATSSQAHINALGELARTTPAYRLATGRDLTQTADLIRALL